MDLSVGCGGNSVFNGVWFFDDCVYCDLRLPVDVGSLGCFVRCDGAFLPFKDGVFDSVYAIDVLEHVESPVRFVRELGRVCCGKFVVGTPNCLHGLNFFYALLHGGSKPHCDHIFVFGRGELENLFRRCGFDDFVVVVDTYGDHRHSFLGNFVVPLLPKCLRRQLVGVVFVA